MTQDPQALGLLALAYFIGSIPFGLILAKLFGMGDIRKVGSGNIGATNILRSGNKLVALLTLLLDAGKGYLAVYLAGNYFAGAVTEDATISAMGAELIMLAGLLAIIGHCFPIWLKFKGGKGVATTFGVLFALSLKLGVVCGATWIIVFFISNYSSLAALTTMVLMPVQAYFYKITDSSEQLIILLIISLLVIVRHQSNIKNLLSGKEHKFGKSNKEGNNDSQAA